MYLEVLLHWPPLTVVGRNVCSECRLEPAEVATKTLCACHAWDVITEIGVCSGHDESVSWCKCIVCVGNWQSSLYIIIDDQGQAVMMVVDFSMS